MEVAANKANNYKQVSLVQDEANLQLMQQALFESNPELFPDDFEGYKITIPVTEVIEHEVVKPKVRASTNGLSDNDDLG
jgi:hypothetical protein